MTKPQDIKLIYPEYNPTKKSNRFIDRTGERFGKLTVVYRTYNKPGENTNWVCKCDCGNYTVVSSNNLTSGHTKSCGCLDQQLRSTIYKKHNQYDFTNDYCIGYTSNTNKQFLVDKEDYDLIYKYCWMENDQGYIMAYTEKRKSAIRLHRFLLQPKENEIIDHINGDRADNRKNNLRISNKQLNGINRDRNSTNISGFKGVSFDKRYNKYFARIMVDGKSIFIGYYGTAEEASKARIEKENELFGDYSYYNLKENLYEETL